MYTKPNFNLLCDFWVYPHTPAGDPADQTDVPVQMYVASRAALDITPGNVLEFAPPIYLRFDSPPVGDYKGAWIYDVPQGDNKFFLNRWKEWVHKGFPNEYWVVVVEQCLMDGTPILRDVHPTAP